MSRRVFVSFDFDRDGHYKQLLAAWAANATFDFDWTDQSVLRPINSSAASRVKAGISRRMKDADVVLVIVGPETSRSEWVGWEIERAKELGLGLVGVKISRSYESPVGLLNAGASWATSFTRDAIVRAIDVALPSRRAWYL